MTEQSNPLLAADLLDHDLPDFSKIKTEHYIPALKTAIAEAEKEIAALKGNAAAPSFENTIAALAFSGGTLDRIYTIFSCLSGANSDDSMRAIEEELEVLVTRHGNNISLDADLFARVKAVHDKRASLNLTPEQNVLLEETYKGFVRQGALLGDNAKQELRGINDKLSELTTKYSTNILKATAAYKKVIDSEDDLKGVPERAKAQYKAAAEREGLTGKYLIRLSPPPSDILEYAENRALREEIQKANGSRAWKGEFDNRGNALEIARLRKRKAELMGFPTYAAYVLDDRMASTPAAVNAMLEKNLAAYKPPAEAFVQKVKDYAAKDGVTDFQPWDFAFYSRKLKEETFKLNLEEVRPYFDLEKVLVGVRQHAEKLFGITLTETKDKYPTYHPDVKVYEVTDKKTGETLGLFCTDYYAREGAKRGGAWETTLRKRGLEGGEDKYPVVFNVCNFAKPKDGEPTLLSLDEVRTIFHEFGHGLHDLLARGNYASLTGTSVKWDFVEVPSQLMENWVREKEVLDGFAAHYKTGAPIPADLIAKIQAMENFDAAYAGMRQTFLGLLDMAWHNSDPATITDVEAHEDAIAARASLFPRVAGPMSVTFSHIFSGGYAAGYYGYKWAEVLEADIFAAFKKNGLYNAELGAALREIIYSKGGTVPPAELFRKLMGREPDPDAMLRRDGVEPVNDNADPKPAPKKSGGPAPK